MTPVEVDPLYREYRQAVYTQALRMLHDEQDALDVLQEVFERVLRYRRDFQPGSNPQAWIRRIVANLCVDKLRKRRTSHKLFLDANLANQPAPRNPEYGPVLGFERREMSTALREALAQLSPEHLSVFVMREIEGLSYEQMAAATQCPPGTIMSRLFYARQKLRQVIGRRLDLQPTRRRRPVARQLSRTRAAMRPAQPEG